MDLSKAKLALRLIKIGAIKFRFYQKSCLGRSLPILDLRLENHSLPSLLTSKIAEKIGQLLYAEANLRKLFYNCVLGISPTGDQLAEEFFWHALRAQKPLTLLRLDEEKGFWQIKGVYREGDSALLIDDIAIGAESQLTAIEAVKESGLKVCDLLVLIDPEQGEGGELKEAGCQCQSHALFKLSELIRIFRRV